MSKSFAFHFALALSILLTACSHDRFPLTDADNGRTITVGVGDAIEIKLGTVGPGEYGTPVVSSSSIRFVSVEVVGPYTPGGPTQLFHFEAVARGQATIAISHDGGSSVSFGITANVAP
jgi:hypothetical protein